MSEFDALVKYAREEKESELYELIYESPGKFASEMIELAKAGEDDLNGYLFEMMVADSSDDVVKFFAEQIPNDEIPKEGNWLRLLVRCRSDLARELSRP